VVPPDGPNQTAPWHLADHVDDQRPKRASTQRTASKPCEGPASAINPEENMAKVIRRLPRKLESSKTVMTLAQAIAAYGGRRPFREAFCISDDQLDDWQRWGEIPRGAQLGLLLGLKERGYTMAPQLVGVDSWADVGGV